MIGETYSNRSDEEIVAEIVAGNAELFGVIVDRYAKKLERYGRKFLSDRDDIDDIVQEVFIKTYQNIRGFDTARRFSPWIYRIAHNAFVNALRAKSRSWISVEWDTFLSFPSNDIPQEDKIEQAEIQELMQKHLSDLTPQYREVLTLHYLEEMSYKDISEVLHVPMGTVGVRIKRAKEALKKKVELGLHKEGYKDKNV